MSYWKPEVGASSDAPTQCESTSPPAWRPTQPTPPDQTDDRDAPSRWASTSTDMPRQKQPPSGQEPAPPRSRPVRHFTWRRILAICLVLFVLLAAVLDRVSAHLAASEMVSQIQKSQQLPTKPEASVGGFPFLTQVLMGDYKDIGLRIRRVAPVADLCVDDIDVHVKGVHLPLSTLIGGKPKSLRIDQVIGTVTLTYTDLNTYLATQPGHLQLAASSGGLRISAPVDLPLIGQIKVFGDVRASVQNNKLTISPTGLGVDGLGSVAIPTGAVQALTVALPLDGLPMNLQLTSASVTSAGIEVTARANHLDLDTTQTQTAHLQAC